MAAKKKSAKKTAAPKAPKVLKAPATDAKGSPVYRLDQGETLPAQKNPSDK